MAIDTGFQHQQPLGYSAAVRSAPSPQHGKHLAPKGDATGASSRPAIAQEEKSFAPALRR